MTKRNRILTLTLLLSLALAATGEARIRRSRPIGQYPQGKIAFTTHMGAFVPTGDFADQAQVGFRWMGALEYYPSRSAALGADFSFAEADAQGDKVNGERRRWETIFGRPVELNTFNYHSYRLGIYGRYTVPTHASVSPYLEGGTGIYWTQRRVSGFSQGGGPNFEFSERRTQTTTGANFGAGVNARLSPNTNLLTGFEFHQLFDDNPNRSFATFKIGLSLYFPLR